MKDTQCLCYDSRTDSSFLVRIISNPICNSKDVVLVVCEVVDPMLTHKRIGDYFSANILDLKSKDFQSHNTNVQLKLALDNRTQLTLI